jgi:bloom syndrome protein
MTRHNLDSHISWLLSSKVAPAVGVHMRNPTAAAAAIEIVDSGSSEDEFGEEFPGVVRIPDPNRPIPHTINVVHDFMRPPVPSISSKSQLREPTNNSREESMGKLTSAQRSTRPGLMSQHQLATPASTTISTAGSSSLRQGYATFLREHNG